jgi:hypothetical protein
VFGKVTLAFLSAIALMTVFAQYSDAQEKGADQVSMPPKTKLGAFVGTVGKVTVFDEETCSAPLRMESNKSNGQIDCRAVVAYTPGHESSRLKGIRLDVSWDDRTKQSKSIFLDDEEIDGFINGLKYVLDAEERLKDERPEHYDVRYTSKDNFVVGFIKYKNVAKDEQNFYIHPEMGSYGIVAFYPTATHLKAFIQIISDSRANLAKR